MKREQSINLNNSGIHPLAKWENFRSTGSNGKVFLQPKEKKSQSELGIKTSEMRNELLLFLGRMSYCFKNSQIH